MKRIEVVILLLLLHFTCDALSYCPAPPKCTCHVNRISCAEGVHRTIDKTGSSVAEYLSYADNKLKDIPDEAFSVFTRLQYLNLSHNAIKKINRDTFKGADYISVLDLSHNYVGLRYSIHPHSLNHIQWLSLESNGYIGEELDREKGKDNGTDTWLISTDLRNLSLANCKLTYLPVWMFRGLTSLEALDISSNQLTVLPVLTLVSMCRLKMLSLNNNTWRCEECENKRASKYMETVFIRDMKNYEFCPTKSGVADFNCNFTLNQEEFIKKNNCLIQPVPEKLKFVEPLSFWAIIAIIVGVLIGLLIISVACNSIITCACRQKEEDNKITFEESNMGLRRSMSNSSDAGPTYDLNEVKH